MKITEHEKQQLQDIFGNVDRVDDFRIEERSKKHKKTLKCKFCNFTATNFSVIKNHSFSKHPIEFTEVMNKLDKEYKL